MHVLLYVPNVIGYFRLCLIFAFIWCHNSSLDLAILAYITSHFLDYLDGYAARKLNQVSKFGAQFDVIIDVIARGFAWVLISPLGFLVSCLEWLVFSFVGTSGPQWKDQFTYAPTFISWVMRNNFRTVQGTIVMFGLDFLPICLLLRQTNTTIDEAQGLSFMLRFFASYYTLFIALIGRLSAAFVELWMVKQHVSHILSS